MKQIGFYVEEWGDLDFLMGRGITNMTEHGATSTHVVCDWDHVELQILSFSYRRSLQLLTLKSQPNGNMRQEVYIK